MTCIKFNLLTELRKVLKCKPTKVDHYTLLRMAAGYLCAKKTTKGTK